MNNMKAIARSWALMSTIFALLVAASTPAFASDGIDIDAMIEMLPAGWASTVTGIFIVLYAVAQLRAVMPPALTNKLPVLVVKVLDFVSANWRHARNAGNTEAGQAPPAKLSGEELADGKYRSIVETAKNNGELRSGSRIESSSDNPGDDRPGSKST